MSFKIYATTNLFEGDYLYDLLTSYSTNNPTGPKAIISNVPSSAVADTIIDIIGFNMLGVNSMSLINELDTSIIPCQYSIISDSLIKMTVPNLPNSGKYKVRVSSVGGIDTYINSIDLTANPVDMTYQHAQIFTYTGSEQTFEIKNITQNTLIVTMIAGGGAGGESRTIGGVQFSGGGGGGGGAIISVPVTVTSDQTITLYVGKGGKSLGVNGENSYITAGSIYTVTGGKAAIYNSSGLKGEGLQDGTNGEEGRGQLPSGPAVFGGSGGQSFVGFGGSSSRILPTVIGYGGGGKGADMGTSDVGVGQDGIIIISYTSS
jgi:hypothetical protein